MKIFLYILQITSFQWHIYDLKIDPPVIGGLGVVKNPLVVQYFIQNHTLILNISCMNIVSMKIELNVGL